MRIPSETEWIYLPNKPIMILIPFHTYSHKKFNFFNPAFGVDGGSGCCCAISMNLRIGASDNGTIRVLFAIL